MTNNGLNTIAHNENADAPDAGMIFEAGAGISEEEQREIMAGINRIAEKNRRSLLAEGGAENRSAFRAKKSGGLFPVLVNLGALALLGGGFFFLAAFQGKADLKVREGTAVYGSAERALIEEIRKETASRIAAKETEIALIVSRLEGVDTELRDLHSSNQELSAEQLAAEEQLKSLQEEYRSSLTVLRDERSRILEEARTREATLRSQLEARIRELDAVSEQNAAALGAARSELEKLSGEQEKADAVEAQLGGHFAALREQIRGGRLDEAADTLRSMRLFLNTLSFQGLRPVQARKELYDQAIDALELSVAAARKGEGGPLVLETRPDPETEQALADLRAENERLEQSVASLNKTVAAFNSQGSGLAQRISELETSVSGLRTANSALETGAAEKDRTIAALNTEKAGLTQTVAERDNAIRDLQAQNTAHQERITSLDNQLTTLRQALQTLSQ